MYLTLDITTEFTTISLFENFDTNSRIKFTKHPTIFNYDLALEKINKKLERLIYKYGEPRASGIAITGEIDYKKNILSSTAYLHDYENKDLIKDLHNTLNCPIYMEQDCVCDALAELENLGKDITEYALITVCYGIGGVVIKKKDQGLFIHPTELGHTIVVPNGLTCPCGQRGCVEAYIGGENMADRFLLRPNQIKDKRIWEDAVDYLAIASTNLLMCYPMQHVIYSGSSISSIPILKNKIKEQLAKRMKVFKQPDIKISTLSHKSNTYGALKLIELNETNSKFYRVA